MTFRGEGVAGLWVAGGPAASPAPPLAPGPAGVSAGRGDRAHTHRPRLPVWASCRMRCSCRFIILGAGWRRRGHRGGRGPAAPGPAACAAALPPGWVGGALRFLGQRAPAPLAPASRSRLRPRPPGHSSLQVWVLAPPACRAPRGPWPARRVSVGRPSVRPSTGVCAAPPRRLTQSRGGKQVSRLLPPRPPRVPAPPTGPPARPGY